MSVVIYSPVVVQSDAPLIVILEGGDIVAQQPGPLPIILGNLSLSSVSFVHGVAKSGAITGATPGSKITASGLPAGLTIDGTAHTWSWDGTGTAATGSFTLTETLKAAINSPLVSTVNYTITASVTLGNLFFSQTSFTVGVAASGTINGATAGSTISASGLPAGVTINGSARTWAYDGSGSATTGTITLTETLAGASNTPHASTISYSVVAAPTLGLLGMSGSFVIGTPSSGTITGATAGSTITAAGLPAGLTINGAARTWTYDGTGSAGSGSFTLTETLAGYANSPRTTTVTYAVSAGTGLGGTGTLPAPILGFPSGGQIIVTLPPGYATGDVVKVATSASLSMSSPTILTHTLSDSDVSGGTISIGLSVTGTGFAQAFGSHAGVDSANLSNIVAWGDAIAPVITTSATQTPNELTQFAIALTATDSGSGVPASISDGTTSGWYISGGADQTLFELAVVGGVVYLRPFGNGTFDRDNPTDVDRNNAYQVQVKAIDRAGNPSTPLTITVTPQAVSKTVTLTPSSFGNVSGATDGTVYPLPNTVVVSGLGTGVAVPLAISGTGFTYSKNGGAYTNAPTTVVNGDSVAMKGLTIGGAALGTVTFGSSPHQVTATGSIADAQIGLSTTNKHSGITLGGGTPPLTFSSNASDSSHEMVSCDTAKASGAIRQWELTVSSNPSPAQLGFGMHDGTVDFTPHPSPEPGRAGQPNGFFFGSGSTNFFTAYNTVSAGSGAAGAADAYASGDVYTVIWDSIGHTITVIRTRSGVTRTMCTATGVTMTTLCPYVGGDQNGVIGTVNFAGPFTYPLSNTSGAVAYSS